MADSEPEDDSMELDEDLDCFSNFLELEEALKKIEASNNKLGIKPDALVHLERYKKAVQKAKLDKPKKATTLHDFWSKK